MKVASDTESITRGRRSLLRGVLTGVAGAAIGIPMSACSRLSPRHGHDEPERGPLRSAPATGKILVAYFSRAGENYYYGGRIELKVGNTEALVGLISKRIRCDVYRIQPADPYPDDYEETVQRNVREQEANARPAIANPLAAIHR